ncbi:MAG: hypothetical protein V4727_13770 [Verrucomicrobiota bacterium]
MTQKYTVFIKPLTLLLEDERGKLRTDIQEALSSFGAVEVGANEFEIQIPDTGNDGTRVRAWNDIKKSIDERAYLVWYRHENGGFTASSFPEGFDSKLGEALQNSPHARLQAIREYLQSIL